MTRYRYPFLIVAFTILLIGPVRAGLFDGNLGDVVGALKDILTVLKDFDKAISNPLAARYGPIWTPWLKRPVARDIGGKNTIWNETLSGGGTDYQAAVTETAPLIDPGGSIGELSPEATDLLQRYIARIYRSDALNAHTLHNIVKVPLHADQNDAKIEALEHDVLSPAPATKHLLAQLQLANTAHVQELHIAQDSNKLLTAVAQQLLLESHARRDGEVQNINRYIEQVSTGLPLEKALSTGVQESMGRFRLP